MRLLIISPHACVARLTAEFTAAGIGCDLAASGDEAEAMIGAYAYGCVLLDEGLKDDAGALLRRLCVGSVDLPVILLTAHEDAERRVAALRDGADDVLARPFLFDELQARILAVTRRQGGYAGDVLVFGGLALDLAAREARVDGRWLPLSAREADLLEPLLRRAGHIVPKRMLEDMLFGASDALGSNAIEVYIHRLRRKLAAVTDELGIMTVRGVGYRLTLAGA